MRDYRAGESRVACLVLPHDAQRDKARFEPFEQQPAVTTNESLFEQSIRVHNELFDGRDAIPKKMKECADALSSKSALFVGGAGLYDAQALDAVSTSDLRAFVATAWLSSAALNVLELLPRAAVDPSQGADALQTSYDAFPFDAPEALDALSPVYNAVIPNTRRKHDALEALQRTRADLDDAGGFGFDPDDGLHDLFAARRPAGRAVEGFGDALGQVRAIKDLLFELRDGEADLVASVGGWRAVLDQLDLDTPPGPDIAAMMQDDLDLAGWAPALDPGAADALAPGAFFEGGAGRERFMRAFDLLADRDGHSRVGRFPGQRPGNGDADDARLGHVRPAWARDRIRIQRPSRKDR